MNPSPGARLACLCLMLAGCATQPEVKVETPRAAEPSEAATLENAYLQRANALARERRWADAAVQWDLLALLRPDSDAYRREADAARRRGADAAAMHVRAAEQARARGNAEQATALYLRALSADPANAAAASGLKSIEAERVRRAWLNRLPRMPYAPPGAANGQPPPDEAASGDPVTRR